MGRRAWMLAVLPILLGQAPAPEPVAGTYPVRAVRIIDGDTFACEVSLPFESIRPIIVRCSGYDSPERYTPRGREATEALTDLLADRPRISAPVGMTFGRYACRVYAGGRDVAAEMKRLGFDGPHGAP